MATEGRCTSYPRSSLLASSTRSNGWNIPHSDTERAAAGNSALPPATQGVDLQQPRRRQRQKRKSSRICAAPTPATGSSPTLRMDNSWDFTAQATQEWSAQGFTETPGFEVGDSYEEHTESLEPETGEGFLSSPPAEGETRGRKQTNKNVPRREKNYSIREDELLCAAYLNVSKDSAVGCNQPSGGYWQRIYQYYHGHKDIRTERSRSSLQHRWSTIQRETTKFCGFYDVIVRRNESGKNEDDKLKDALQMYQGLNKNTAFGLVHCWCILRHERKWNEWLASLNKDKNPPPPAATPTDDQNSNAQSHHVEERPMGRDKAKKLKAISTASSSSSACLEVLQKMHMDRAAFEERQGEMSKEILNRADRKLAAQERLAAAQERLATMQEYEYEQRIMSIDPDKVVPWQRNYYINLQHRIIEKYAGGSAGSNATDGQ